MSRRSQQGIKIDAVWYNASKSTSPSNCRVSQWDTIVILYSKTHHVLVLSTASPPTHAVHTPLANGYIFMHWQHTACPARCSRLWNYKERMSSIYTLTGQNIVRPPKWNITENIVAKRNFEEQRSIPRVKVVFCGRHGDIIHWRK